VGLGGTVKLGLNPGELLDFILGWTTLDIFHDDIAGGIEMRESNQASDATSEPAPGADSSSHQD